MKICGHCKIEKLQSDFSLNCSKKDGLRAQCKDCDKAYYKTHQKERANYQRTRRRTSTGKVVMGKWARKHRLKYPEKAKAIDTVNNAIKADKLRRPLTCESCNKEKFVEGHHPDYDKPLEVEWLCKKCHTELHKNLVLV